MGRRKTLPTGVTIRQYATGREVLVVTFTYKGKTCRETLSIEPTPANIKYAERLRASVQLAIVQQTFDYPAFFPDSPNAHRFDSSKYARRSVAELCEEAIDEAERLETLEKSTLATRIRQHRAQIEPNFSDVSVVELRTSHLEDWIIRSGLKKTSAEAAMSTMRLVIRRALADQVITVNPISYIDWRRVIKKEERMRKSKDEIDPFRDSEIAAILAHARTEKNIYQFAFYTGLRLQELPLVKWANVDWERDTLLLDEAYGTTLTGGNYVKRTKTDQQRTVLMLPPALDALRAQQHLTQMKSEYIFLNPRTGEPYQLQHLNRKWTFCLRRAKVRHRSIKQTRHTFASQALSKGERELWVADQLGHADLSMLRDHYAKWMPEEEGAAYKLRGDWNFCTDSARKESKG